MTKQSEKENGMTDAKSPREPYAKPKLVKHDNLKDVTFECPSWQCSVVVPTNHP